MAESVERINLLAQHYYFSPRPRFVAKRGARPTWFWVAVGRWDDIIQVMLELNA